MNENNNQAVTSKACDEQKNKNENLVNEYSFDNFIVGKSNETAYDAAFNIANPNYEYKINPLFICGFPGLGKTHLLNAIKLSILELYPHSKLIHSNGNEFLMELIDASCDSKMNEFRKKYYDADYLLVDDIQHFANIKEVQDEFFEICNTLENLGKQVVFASEPPDEASPLYDRIKTHFHQTGHGLLAKIIPPEEALRIKIIKHKTQQFGLSLPNDVINNIAASVKSNIRELEGVIKGISARKDILGEDITIDSVKAHLDYIENINDVSKKKNKIPDNISVNVELNIKKLCENTGFINLDEDDYKNVLDGAEQIYIGSGHSAGEGKSKKAASLAITNPMMAMPFNKALKVMIIITGSLDIDLDDVESAANLIANSAHPDAKIIFGAFFDDDMEEEMRIDVIATN